jgi:hypothetical protein
VIFTIIAAIATICFLIYNEGYEKEQQKMSRKWMWWSYPFVVFFWFLYIFTPSKKDALLIVAGGQTLNYLTTDSTAKKLPHEALDFVVSELRLMATEAKLDLNITSQKDKILESVKTMTADEVLTKMKADTTFAKIVLGK